jgi:hypothetical protein
MIRYLTILLMMAIQYPACAQREYGVCDSTFYTLNTDTTIIAGRHHLYLYSNNITETLYDFTSANTHEYIRDFDIVTPDLWFTVVGLKYIGGPTRLYKSTNRGQNWSLDTNHHQAANSESLSQGFLQSINNLQHLNGDTLVMFMHYYESGIIYSTDLGQNWTKWFDNLIAHYQGMFACNNKYYIFGYEGDAFPASMFGFDRNLLFTPDSTGMWNSFNSNSHHPPCYNGVDTAQCIYATNNLTRCETYHFFKNTIDTLCLQVSTEDIAFRNAGVYPNPFRDKIFIKGMSGDETYTITNLYGQAVWAGNHQEQYDFDYLKRGIYFLIICKDSARQVIKLVKE